ncbi:MAG: DUF835 domain-containing protein, partial [Thermoplasmata archaeon]|nr:DUF835 domain-containing protein [Thermoplasmata archaeon]
MKRLRLLLVDDNPNDRALTLRELQKEFKIKVKEIKDAKEFEKVLKDFDFNIVITDYKLGWTDGLEVLHNIKKSHPYCPVIMYTGTGTEEVAVNAMKAGLDDYVLKSPKHFMRLPAAVNTALQHAREREELYHAEEALRESEEKYRTLFEASPEAVVLIGLEGTILDCNYVAIKFSGLTKENLIGQPFVDLKIFDEEQRSKLIELFPKALKGDLFGPIELALNTDKYNKWWEASPAPLKKGEDVYALQLIVRDITDRKRTEEELKKRLMTFKLEDGKNYLVQERVLAVSVEAFNDLLKIGYHGLVISRTPEHDFKQLDSEADYEFLWLAEKSSENVISPKLNELERKIENLFKNMAKKNAILIERLDYLIFKNGFRKTLSFVQRIRELSYLTGNIVIMSLDPTTLNRRKVRFLEKEGIKIEPRLDKKKLTDELLKILKCIYQN